jgi:RecA/RadA recombinase
MSDFFGDVVKSVGDDNIFLADDGNSSAEFAGFIDTGSYILNAAFSGSLYGGVPDNKITAFAGETTTGKTYFVLGIVKQFLDANPDAAVFYFDTESAVTKQMMSERGIDVKRVFIVEPESIEQFRHRALTVLEKYTATKESKRPRMMFVLDSLGNMSSNKELKDTAEGSDTRDMTKGQLLRATFRVLTLKLAKARVPMLVTNHVYDAIGGYGDPKTMSGGGGLKFAGSQIAFLSKRKEKDGKEVIGNQIVIKMKKSRLSKENTESCVLLTYKHGLDRYFGLLELAEKYGIFKKISTKYELPDGKKYFGKTIVKDPEKFFTPEIMEQLEKAAHKEYYYGADDEEDLDEIYGSEEEDA